MVTIQTTQVFTAYCRRTTQLLVDSLFYFPLAIEQLHVPALIKIIHGISNLFFAASDVPTFAVASRVCRICRYHFGNRQPIVLH
ncbi:hypothetical protein D3C71_1521250 [compost metagenome]